MAYRRDNPNDSRTGIPFPPSAMKGSNPQQSSRNVGPRRSNFGLPGIVQARPPPSSSANALGRSQLGPPPSLGSSSSLRVDHGRTPVKSNIGSSARKSLAPSRMGMPTSASGHKDPRPIRDKAYQLMEQKEILEYLLDIEMNLVLPTLSIKTLQGPSGREFIEIWKRLVEELDPDYVYPVVEPEKGKASSLNPKDKDATRSMAEEFIQVMKDLRYPFIDSISKQSLQAPSAPHAWQSILACLHWMVQQAKVPPFLTFLPYTLNHQRFYLD